MKSLWDDRYSTAHFVYGKEPNTFFAGAILDLPPGRLLLPGEGEGRNAAFAAGLGWEVDAFDQSEAGASKARVLMKEFGVTFNYQVTELTGYSFKKGYYQAVGLVFFHVMPDLRKFLHHQVAESLVPGGKVILEAFHTSQLGNTTGGPPVLEMLYDQKTLLHDFPGMGHELIEESEVILEEGHGHSGLANVIRYIGIKTVK